MKLQSLLRSNRVPTVVGFDDAPFVTGQLEVPFSGVICRATRMEGLVWGGVTRDGTDATEAILAAIRGKFQGQLHAALVDGLTLAGLNVVDLQQLHDELQVPVLAVLRRPPNRPAFRAALEQAGLGERWSLVEAAGSLHQRDGRVFHVAGASPELAVQLLERVTDRGKVPECLRLAHLIGGAVVTGTSGKRA